MTCTVQEEDGTFNFDIATVKNPITAEKVGYFFLVYSYISHFLLLFSLIPNRLHHGTNRVRHGTASFVYCPPAMKSAVQNVLDSTFVLTRKCSGCIDCSPNEYYNSL